MRSASGVSQLRSCSKLPRRRRAGARLGRFRGERGVSGPLLGGQAWSCLDQGPRWVESQRDLRVREGSGHRPRQGGHRPRGLACWPVEGEG
eukprot:3763133-Alexandrium_andersonii.AAC.1